MQTAFAKQLAHALMDTVVPYMEERTDLAVAELEGKLINDIDTFVLRKGTHALTDNMELLVRPK